MTDYTLVRSRRKTVALYVREGGLEVRAPLVTPKREIDRLVASKQRWIMDRLAESAERASKRNEFTLDYGNTLTYRQKEYPIAAADGNRAGFDDERFYMPQGL